jgi:hypothetical protein
MRKKLALKLSLGAAAIALGAAAFASRAEADAPYTGSAFADVWSVAAADPYSVKPHYAVNVESMFGFLDDKMLDAANRTLSDREDVLPPFRKLVHPNGICLAGTWNVTDETPYTGYFRKGSRGLFIGRASTALTATERGEFRAFGFAGKIFPTTDPNEKVSTANFFTIEDLGGTLRDHYLDAANTNDIINVSLTPETFLNTVVGGVVAQAFLAADHTLDITQTLIRQLYPIAELGEADASKAVAPPWLMITGAPEIARVDAADFRDELRLGQYPNGLRFDIRIADVGTRIGPKNWRTIGFIEVTADALADGCDHRLHFHHPQFRH